MIIDALIDFSDDDEDGAEIFNDSDDDDDDMPSEKTPSSIKSTLSNAASGALQDVLNSLDGVTIGGGGGATSDDDDDDDDDNEKSNNSDSAEDYTDDEDEGEEGYKPGGYHPVKVGEVYNQRCVVCCLVYIIPFSFYSRGCVFTFLSSIIVSHFFSITDTQLSKSLVGATLVRCGW